MGFDLSSKVSKSDVNRIKDMHNPLKYDTGDFDNLNTGETGSKMDSSFDSLFDDCSFDDFDSYFNGGSSNSNNSGGSGNNSLDSVFPSTQGGMGNNSISTVQNNGFGFNNLMANNNTNNNQTVAKQDNLDKAMEFSGKAIVSIAKMLLEMVKSIGNRTADDLGYYSNNLIKTGLIGLVVSILIAIVAPICGANSLGVNGFAQYIIKAFTFTGFVGALGLAVSAKKILGESCGASYNINDVPDVSANYTDDSTKEYEDDLDILDDLFSLDDDEIFIDDDSSSNNTNELNYKDNIPDFGTKPIVIDLEERLSNITENRMITRKLLLDTFIPFLALNTPEFSKKQEIEQGDDEFSTLETICFKALANVLRCDMEEVKSELETAYETYFSYELRLKRVRGLNKTNELSNELAAYFRHDSSDNSVNVNVDIEGDFYKIIVTKGVTAIVTFGDAFKINEVYDFFSNEKNKLPMITGIDELGKIILDDAKIFDSMLIAGKPRSGKSWYVFSVLMILCLFNTPEDVQFVIVDPKKSPLFKTMALLPHVAGLHDDKDILRILDDIITNEGERRKKLLDDCGCNDIWALHKKGVKLPVLYVVIDEYISVRNNLGDDKCKELDKKIMTLISQLPSLGIRLIIVPHRATGVVNKTNRTMLQFTAAVRSDIEDVKDTLGVKEWKRALTNQGDIAIKSSSTTEGKYVRGAAVTTTDEDNEKLVKCIAEAFYKMGIDLPDMSSMQFAVNRDEVAIREELCNKNRIQYTANNVFDNIK